MVPLIVTPLLAPCGAGQTAYYYVSGVGGVLLLPLDLESHHGASYQACHPSYLEMRFQTWVQLDIISDRHLRQSRQLSDQPALWYQDI